MLISLFRKLFTVSYSAVFTLEKYRITAMIAKFFVLPVFLVLTGCSFLPHILYKIDVQQGNVVTEEMIEKLKPGMTKSQVLFVMGSPLIIDAFRENRWDYVYLFREKGELIEQKRLTVFFETDLLVNIENHLVFSKDPVKPKPTDKNSNDENNSSSPNSDEKNK